jgi:hypothetical protein
LKPDLVPKMPREAAYTFRYRTYGLPYYSTVGIVRTVALEICMRVLRHVTIKYCFLLMFIIQS